MANSWSSDLWVRCSACEVNVKKRNFEKHKLKVHTFKSDANSLGIHAIPIHEVRQIIKSPLRKSRRTPGSTTFAYATRGYIAPKPHKAQGQPGPEIGSVITLFDSASLEDVRYFLSSQLTPKIIIDHQNNYVYLAGNENVPINVDEHLYQDCDFAIALRGKFAQEQVVVHAPGGKFTYHIRTIMPCVAQPREALEGSRLVESSTRQTPNKIDIRGEAYCFVAREDGKFGSFSKHDDYGDESNAEVRDYDDRFGPSLTQPEHE